MALPWPQTVMPVCCEVTGTTDTVPARVKPRMLRVRVIVTSATTVIPMPTPSREGVDGVEDVEDVEDLDGCGCVGYMEALRLECRGVVW